jgi:RHS repeat-associated protein
MPVPRSRREHGRALDGWVQLDHRWSQPRWGSRGGRLADDAWGMLLERTGSTVNPHTYVGRERYYRMPNAEMYHLGFRDYAQGVGRFMTVDPVRDGLNWFAYVRNGSTAMVDPSGAAPWWWTFLEQNPPTPSTPDGTCVVINCDRWMDRMEKRIGHAMVGSVNWCVDQFVSVDDCRPSCMSLMRFLRSLGVMRGEGEPPNVVWVEPWPSDPLDQHPIFKTCLAGCWGGRNAFALACTVIAPIAIWTAYVFLGMMYGLCVHTFGHGDNRIRWPDGGDRIG